MKTQQRGLEENSDTPEPAWLNPEGAESGNHAIPDAEVGDRWSERFTINN
jgi:hypothetical protein